MDDILFCFFFCNISLQNELWSDADGKFQSLSCIYILANCDICVACTLSKQADLSTFQHISNLITSMFDPLHRKN